MMRHVVIGMLMLLCVCAGLSQAETFTGGAGTTNWLDDGNWSDGTSPGNDATLNELYVTGTCEMDYTATQGTCTETVDCHLGHVEGDVVVVNVLGGTLQFDNNWGVILGQRSSGTLNIDGGNFVQVNDKNFMVGNRNEGGDIPASGTINLLSGSLVVAAFTAEFEIGREAGTGIVNISGGTANFAKAPDFAISPYREVYGSGSINFPAGSTGSLTIAGADYTYYSEIYAAGNLTYDGSNASAFDAVSIACLRPSLLSRLSGSSIQAK